jgi:hypothetical protein
MRQVWPAFPFAKHSVIPAKIAAAEKALAEAEDCFILGADKAQVLTWISPTDKVCTHFNKAWFGFKGGSLKTEFENGSAECVHLMGIATGIAKRERCEEIIAKVSSRLIEAREQEFLRVARELHYNTNQRLALLPIVIEQINIYFLLGMANLHNRLNEIGKMPWKYRGTSRLCRMSCASRK